MPCFYSMQRLGFLSVVLTGPLLVLSLLLLWSQVSRSPRASFILQGGFSPFLCWAKASKWPLIFFSFSFSFFFFFPLAFFCFVLFCFWLAICEIIVPTGIPFRVPKHKRKTPGQLFFLGQYKHFLKPKCLGRGIDRRRLSPRKPALRRAAAEPSAASCISTSLLEWKFCQQKQSCSLIPALWQWKGGQRQSLHGGFY